MLEKKIIKKTKTLVIDGSCTRTMQEQACHELTNKLKVL